jgi:hypothetical protein
MGQLKRGVNLPQLLVIEKVFQELDEECREFS